MMVLLNLYSQSRAQKIIDQNSALIESICASYHLPSACLKAILRMELPEINMLDELADIVVAFNWVRYSLFGTFDLDRHTRNPLRKYDSSTGYGQIFAQVAIEAILFAESQDIPVFLGITGELSPFSPYDLKRVWARLHHDKVFNLSCAALNIIHAAFEMTGRVDFEGYNEREIKMTLTRYNGNAKTISSYGEKAYLFYLEYLLFGCVLEEC